MRRVIEGKAFDTKSATEVVSGDNSPMSDAWWGLYRTKDGVFFKVVVDHDGETVTEFAPLSNLDARAFLERRANYLVEEYFGPMPEPSPSRFSRNTIIAAVETMEPWNHAQLTRYLLKLGPDIASRVGEGGTIAQRLNRLIALSLDELPAYYTLGDGNLLHDVLVENGVATLPGYGVDTDSAWQEADFMPPQPRNLLRSLQRDGFTVSGGQLRRLLPVDVALPVVLTEIERLLAKHGFDTAKGHLDQALGSHGDGKWASANSQLRTFLQAICEAMADALGRPQGEEVKRLADGGFLYRELNERVFIDALFKRLHPMGSHPGLSDDDDSTYRLHIVLLTARLLLARFDARPKSSS
ncbi:hypothetical protein [Telmatospirillum sp.]|uniref:hypothetical protein n=1 Tax=Telmatospirillum sp. TaxID=2079197 RepID=UPI0028444E5F|nr:hypothetical protein [Telmatospirillum sp.]MDR3436315.1 hypothetical protein [Telmatospirillum sp.]